MKRTASIALLVLVVATAGAIPVVAAQPSSHANADSGSPPPASTNATESGSAPGAELSGALSAHGAEINGAVTARAFTKAYQHGGSNVSKARIVANQTMRIDARLTALSDRLDALRAARANESISSSAYHARVTATVAQIRQTRRLVNTTVVAAADLPPSARATASVDVTVIHGLAERASNLTDSQDAGIDRTIAGDRAGSGYGADTATRKRAESAVAAADARVTTAARLVRTVPPQTDATTSTLRDQLAVANRSRAKARTALDDGRYADAIAFAADAEAHAHAVILAAHGTSGVSTSGTTTVTGTQNGSVTGNVTTPITRGANGSADPSTPPLENGTSSSPTTNLTLAGTNRTITTVTTTSLASLAAA